MMRFLLVLFASSACALEPWANPALPVKDGLEVWLDARVQGAAREARKLLPSSTDGGLEAWLDGSGLRRDVRQPMLAARPKLVASPGGAFVQFDGQDDFLSAAPGRTLEAATVFVVAAPRTNPGQFRAFFALNRAGRNDYITGLNLDLGGKATTVFSTLNTEAAGASGERGLLNTQFDFGTFHVFSLTADARTVRLSADGEPQGKRDRKNEPIGMDELTVGARCLSHEGLPAYPQSFLHGDISELVIFGRALPDAERAAVEKYLLAKHSGLRSAADSGLRPLVPVKDPPPVQMLLPGFEVRELPLQLTNIDCLRYRADGVLVAGAYNGKIWLLRDTDGDGSEDKADVYWESADLKHVIGMDLTRPGDPRGPGVFVATAGRILFIPDKNGDNRGDEQIVIASGWEKQASPGGGGSVDALGLVVAPDGSIYFGLGVSAYNNAYLLDKDGKSHFDLATERGTVQRISPDFSKRETICTGIRYPVGAAFNRHGDLFMTEQEGATWLPNGNPFDELVHIQRGRHYGFPPRHPKHLPNVIDEPSVFDYGPQHQSTCGFVFNDGPKIFGPEWWRGDAFVTGESRGKLWRTKLVKTEAGYVAQNQLIACLSMLPVDVTLSPRGDLIVACHSGAPDWGTGPGGAGKLFRISRSKIPTPLPVLAWPAGPGEIRIAFDAELDPERLKGIAKQIEITAGRYVSAGDRFESFRPGYQVVKDQMAAPRRAVSVLGATLSADRRTLLLAVPPQSAAGHYAITLPDFLSGEKDPKSLLRHPQIDLATDMSGVEAIWDSADGKEHWQGWLPHLDLAGARELTAGSAEHAELWEHLKMPGKLTLKGQLNLFEMLQPAIQPGAKLDYERPIEHVLGRFESNQPMTLKGLLGAYTDPPRTPSPQKIQRFDCDARAGNPLGFVVSIDTGNDPVLHLTWSTAEDRRERAFPARRFLMPFAKPATDAAPAAERVIPEIAGGNWLRGRSLYFGKSQCATCHTIRGEGGRVGPDLSNLVSRDLASVERDIRDPGAALNPDHLTYHVTFKDGTETAAVLLTEDKDKVRIGEATGVVRDVARTDLREMKVLPVSLMPPALLDTLTSAERKDLLTFLLTSPPLEPAPIEAKDPPPPRKRAELEAVLKQSEPLADDAKQPKLRVLLVSGKKDHGRGEHDYPLFQKRWAKLLALGEGVEVATAQNWPTAEQFAGADVVVFYSSNPEWKTERQPEFDAFLQRGGGAVFIHWAIEGRTHAPALADCIGLASDSRQTRYRHGELTMTFPQTQHPITRGFGPTKFVDETYWALVGDPKRFALLGEAIEEGEPRPQIWAFERGKGRVFANILGHYTWTFDDPLARVLLLRGICWAARQPVDRLSELATVGARLE